MTRPSWKFSCAGGQGFFANQYGRRSIEQTLPVT
jgi:hypothetical protein